MTVPDCQTCGLCCISPYEANTYVDVTPKDEARLGEKFVRLHVLNGSIKTVWAETKRGPMKGFKMNRCAALRGNIGFGVRCSVYENRPAICRMALVPGDEACLAIRNSLTSLQEDR